MRKQNVAVIGVGAVGAEILKILKERNFPINSLRVFARTARAIKVDDIFYNVEAIENSDFSGIDIALFAGTEGAKGASVLYAEKFIEKGAVVVDNGNDFRLKENVPLVVPEVNRERIAAHKGLIANPNCTTIQAVTALGGIFKKFGLNQFILTSFQATSGAGKEAAISLWNETRELVGNNKGKDFDNLDKKIKQKPKSSNPQVAFNVIPQIGSFEMDGYTSEEIKVVHESRKIFRDDSIKISATCVRVPVFTSHSEAIYFTTRKKATVRELEEALKNSEGVEYQPDNLCLPVDAEGRDEVFVSRLRSDPNQENSFWLWCVSDNLRKGAALNAIQIAEYL